MPDLTLALLVLVPLAAVELAKAARWAALLGRRPTYVRCLQALVSGQLTNLVSPVRAGEVVQVGLVTFRGGSFMPAAATLVGLKLLDAGVLLLLAGAVFGTGVFGNATFAFLLAGAAGLLGVGLAARSGRLRRAISSWPLAERLGIGRLASVRLALRDPRVLLVVVSASGVVWVAGVLANTLVLAAVGIQPTLDLAARVLVAGYVVGVLPAPPLRLGVFETAVTLALTTAGVAPLNALAASITLHIGQFCELGLLALATLVHRRWLKPA